MDHKKLAEVGVLGTLQEYGPAGVDTIQDRLQHSFQRYWSYSHGVLSPAIDRLLANGCIRKVKTEDSTQNTKYAYNITDQGINHLRTLLQKPLTEPDTTDRTGLLIQVGFLHHLPPADQRRVLTNFEEKLRQQRQEWKRVRSIHAEEIEASMACVGYRPQIVDLNIRLLTEQLEWLQSLEPERTQE